MYTIFLKTILKQAGYAAAMAVAKSLGQSVVDHFGEKAKAKTKNSA